MAKWLEPANGWCCSPCLDQDRYTQAVVILNDDEQEEVDGVQREGLCGNHAELVDLDGEVETW